MDSVSTSRDYFDNLYKGSVDPFRNWKNDYEDAKRERAISVLSRDRYGSIFEPGCGNGALTLDLSTRCEKIVSADWSQDALNSASLHCAGVPNIEFRVLDFPGQIPEEKFDLIVVSELLYYFSDIRLRKFFDVLPGLLNPGGEILLVHWRGLSDDYPSCGDTVHQTFHNHDSIELIASIEQPQYLISAGQLR